MLLLEKTFATEVRKDEVAEVQVEQAEREVGAAAEQGRSWGPSCTLLLAAKQSLRALVCRQVLADLSQSSRRRKIIMRLMAGLACESLTPESERV